MGARGPGARSLREAREALPARKRRLPWERKGLSRADRMIAFLQWLPITKGPLAGKRMKLLPGQRKFVKDLYRTDAKGRRQTRLAIRSEPRGNGKTGLVAGLCLAHLLGPEAEERGEVYSAGIDRQQAGLLFNEMEAVIVRVPEFKYRVNIQRFHKRMEVLEGAGHGSIYEALSADARRAHGLSPTLWAYDELAQTQSAELLENLRTAMGKRKESLGIILSTQAPDDDHVLSRLIDDGLSGVDPSILVDLTTVSPDADPFDLKTLLQANPAAGIFLDRKTLQDELEQARRIPAFESRFRNLRANQRAEANPESRLITAAVWRLGAAPVDRASLRGRVCYGALDLSGSRDLTALSLVFPRVDDEFDVLPLFWTPEQRRVRRECQGHEGSRPASRSDQQRQAACLRDRWLRDARGAVHDGVARIYSGARPRRRLGRLPAMSANVIVRQDDGIVIATDGIAYDGQGIVVAHVSKVALMPEWSCAFAVRGAGVVPTMMLFGLSKLATLGFNIAGFDDFLSFLPAAAEEVHKALLSDPTQSYPQFSMMIGGYSEAHGRFESYSLRSRDFEYPIGDEIHQQPAYTLAPLPSTHFAPTPSPEACAAVGLYQRGPDDPPEAPQVTAIRGVCAARLDKGSLPGDEVNEDYSIGGFVQLTTILRDSVTSEIVHRWPDVIGEKLDPTRGEKLPAFLRD